MVIQSPPNRPEPPPDKNQMMIRAATLGVIAVVLFGVLVFRLWALQVLHSDHYVAQANQNDVRQLPLPARSRTARGRCWSRTPAMCWPR
jgi:cell division protein FtsI/penicillin-binding protein 2